MKKLKEIYHKDRLIVIMMLINLVLATILLAYTVIKIDPNRPVAKIGYGDIGGYRDGSWTNGLVYPLAAILFGVLHNLLALRIFQRRGAVMTKFFLLATTMLILMTFVVAIRILEGF